MKKIIIKLSGNGEVYWMENIESEFQNKLNEIDLTSDSSALEDEGILDGDLYDIPFILSDLEITWKYEGGEEHSITKKGKYIKSKDYLSSKFNSPFYVQTIASGHIEEWFKSEISDDEEFDPKKLQLVKSDYEVDFLPYGIVVDHIYYDGKKYDWYDPQGYVTNCFGGRTWIYKEAIPYA